MKIRNIQSIHTSLDKRKALVIEKDILDAEKRSNERFKDLIKVKADLSDYNSLIIARRWSSNGPAKIDIRGGGYIIILDSIGIVIDPGYDFMNNFYNLRRVTSTGEEQKLSYLNINYVIITHNHQDHVADFIRLLDATRSKLREVTVFLTPIAKKAFRLFLNKRYFKIKSLRRNNINYNIPEAINYMFQFSKAYHCELLNGQMVPGRPKGLSIKKLNKKILSITSDTKYNNNLRDSYEGTKLLIPHISSVQNSPNHLCLKGTETLINETQPDFVILSEFDYEDFNDPNSRNKTALLLKKNTNKTILAGDIGLEVKIEKKFLIKCICRGNKCSNYHWVNPKEVIQIEIDSSDLNERKILYFATHRP